MQNFIKNLVTWIYNYFVSLDEQAENFVRVATESQKNALVVSYLKRELPLLHRTTPEYTKAIEATKDLVALHHNAQSFELMCHSYVRSVVPPSYYIQTAISNLLAKQYGSATTYTHLIQAVGTAVTEAQAVTNPIKRRALVRAVIKESFPLLSSEETTLLIELLLAPK